MYIFPHKLKRSMYPQLLHQHLLSHVPEPTTLLNIPFSGTLSFLQGLSVVDQEKIDNLMLEMDGTENKCNLLFISVWEVKIMVGGGRVVAWSGKGTCWAERQYLRTSVSSWFCPQPSSVPMPSWEFHWLCARQELQRRMSPCTGTLLTWQATPISSFLCQ